MWRTCFALSIKETETKTKQTVSKLRTYVTLKSNYGTEKYLKLNISKSKNERYHLAQFRCTVFPQKIETGRFSGLATEERLCQVCDQNAVESEIHFLLHYHAYKDLRKIPIDKSVRKDNSFRTLTEKLKFILNHEERECARFIANAMSRLGRHFYTAECYIYQYLGSLFDT